nr:GGDEF domain-containing protein [Granulicella sp. dw_53]
MTAARLRNDLERLAGTDALTGTLNRRAIEREVQFAVDRSRENRGSVSALMLDVDYFKQINDNYGHHAGDLALCAIAECLRRTIRAGDLLARLGGDEFLVVMPNSTAEIAQIAANRIQVQLATLRVASDNAEFGIQASIGVTTLDSQNLQLEDLMQLGDRALYEVKARNRRPPSASQPLVLSAQPQASM